MWGLFLLKIQKKREREMWVKKGARYPPFSLIHISVSFSYLQNRLNGGLGLREGSTQIFTKKKKVFSILDEPKSHLEEKR